MFSYYGSKSKIAHLYPKPKHGKIIEPFAGSARYSLRYFENDVELYDLSHHVISVWQYLIQASEKDILSLPNVPSKVNINTYTQLIDAEKWLIGFNLCRGKAIPRKVGHGQNNWARDKVRIAGNLYKIRHWKVFQESYLDIAPMRATWFIDPPYQTINTKQNSDRYLYSEIDYSELKHFCKTRIGQVIVCENQNADWLPFQYLCITGGNSNNQTTKLNKEYVYLQG